MKHPEVPIPISMFAQDISDDAGKKVGKILKRILPHKHREGVSAPAEVAKKFNQESLVPILSAAYGDEVYWQEREKSYYDALCKWEFRPIDREIKKKWSSETKQTYRYLKTIILWAADPETRGHLDPAPGIPVFTNEGKIIDHRVPDFRKQEEIDQAIAHLARHYFNGGGPQDVAPIISVNPANDDELLAVAVVRWKDRLIPKGERIASIEGLIVDPKQRRKGVGLRLITSVIDFAFYKYKGYARHLGGLGARQIRAWVMADELAGNYSANLNFFERKLGFHKMEGRRSDWQDYASMLGEETERNAYWLHLEEKGWKTVKAKLKDQKQIEPYDIIGV